MAGIAYKDEKLDFGNAKRIVFFARADPAQEITSLQLVMILKVLLQMTPTFFRQLIGQLLLKRLPSVIIGKDSKLA